MNYPVTNYQEGYANIGRQVATAVEAVPTAMYQQEQIKRERAAYDEVQNKMKDKKAFKLELVKAGEFLVDNSPYNPDQKEKLKGIIMKQIAASDDIEESAKNIARFKFQIDKYNQTKQENPGAVLVAPTFGWTEDQYDKMIQTAVTNYQNKDAQTTLAEPVIPGTTVPLNADDYRKKMIGLDPNSASYKMYQSKIDELQGKQAATTFTTAGGGTRGAVAVMGEQGKVGDELVGIGKTQDATAQAQAEAAAKAEAERNKPEDPNKSPVKVAEDTYREWAKLSLKSDNEFKGLKAKKSGLQKLKAPQSEIDKVDAEIVDKKAEMERYKIEESRSKNTFVQHQKNQSDEMEKVGWQATVESEIIPAAQKIAEQVVTMSDWKGTPGDYDSKIDSVMRKRTDPPAYKEEIRKYVKQMVKDYGNGKPIGDTSGMEPVGGGTTKTLLTATDDDVTKAARAALTKSLGRAPKDEELMVLVTKMRAVTNAGKK